MRARDVFQAVAEAAGRSRDLSILYATWWAGVDPTTLSIPPTVDPTMEEMHDAEVWTLLSVMPDGTACLARGGEIGRTPPGEWLSHGAGEAKVSRRSRWTDRGFLWRTSTRLHCPVAGRWRVRIYLPAGTGIDPKEQLESLCDALDREGFWFEAKTWLGPASRGDQTVLWVHAGDAMKGLEILRDWGCKSAGRQPPPPLTLRALDGAVGIAHDPLPQASLGLRLCGAIVSAGDLGDHLSLRDRWRSACQHFDLAPEAPWRHPGSVDPYRLWEQLER